MSEARTILIDPLVDNNPVTLQMLGICSALAVTTARSRSPLRGLRSEKLRAPSKKVTRLRSRPRVSGWSGCANGKRVTTSPSWRMESRPPVPHTSRPTSR